MKSNSENKLSAQTNETALFSDIKAIIQQARSQVFSAVNSAMVQAYWLIGRRIVEEEQGGEKRAEYGKQVIATLSRELTNEFGRGFSIQSLKNFRQFYLTFSELPIGSTVWSQSEPKGSAPWSFLSWSHFKAIMRVSDPAAREYYIREAAANQWSVRTLDRNIATQYFQRLLASQVKEPVIREMEEKTAPFRKEKLEFIKNPSVLEFLNLPSHPSFTETQIETAIIDNLHQFLLELGRGFAFVERQKLIRTETRDYFVDLVFYNFILKCFVLIDLKTERITHQDVGQMDMYIRMYDETMKGDDDNPTVGIVLCSETDHDIARYSILKGNEQIFATKYKLYLPTEEELAAEIAREKELIRLQLEREGE
ncbi:MAG: PDDEXK nuclease domain-containing protein [Lentisphaeria bacterium]|nr:PDDEXK nuclease domain-containing protein [Lentisphaeria bacterium]